MYLKEQTYVCALAEQGNMTQAAAKLFISQPALSAYIKCVEDRLGSPLFVRKDGRFVLTFLGERYVDRARKMLELQDLFNREMSLIQRGDQGRVRLGLQTRRSPIIIADIMRFFADHYPQIELSVEEGNHEKLSRLLRENNIDVMICSIDKREDGVGYRSLGREKLLLAVHESSPLLNEADAGAGLLYPLISMEKLANETFFLPRTEQSLRRTSDALFASKGFTPKKVMEIRSIEASLRLVSEGLGVAFNRTSYAQNMDIPGIRYLRIQGDDTSSEVVVAYSPEYERVASIRKLLDALVDTLHMG